MAQKSGPANLLRGAESVGGQLLLDGRLLRFEPHKGNAQRRAEVIEVVDIKRLDPVWTRFLGVLPVFPNGLKVTMRNGQVFDFTVSGRKGWIDALGAAHTETPKG